MIDIDKKMNELYKVYEHVNKKNFGKLNLDSFKTDNNEITYSVKEDVIDEIIFNMNTLNSIIQNLNEVDLSKELHEINNLYDFKKSLIELVSISAYLESNFKDLYEFNNEFIKSLPEKTKSNIE